MTIIWKNNQVCNVPLRNSGRTPHREITPLTPANRRYRQTTRTNARNMHGYQKQTPSTPARELYIGAIRKGNNGKMWTVVQGKRALRWVQNVPNPKKRKVPLKNRCTRKKKPFSS